MTLNETVALSSSLHAPQVKDAVAAAAAPLAAGLRFFRHGHWWEIDGFIKGRASGYYRCKPVCFVESRFYTESEINQALEEESTTMNHMNHKTEDCTGRGTGRLTFEPVRAKAIQSNQALQRRPASRMPVQAAKKDPLKVLVIGSRQTVKRAIQMLHLAGFADVNEWSAFQNRANSHEVLSILVHKI